MVTARYASTGLSYKEQQIIEELRALQMLGYGELRVTVKAGKPVTVRAEKIRHLDDEEQRL